MYIPSKELHKCYCYKPHELMNVTLQYSYCSQFHSDCGGLLVCGITDRSVYYKPLSNLAVTSVCCLPHFEDHVYTAWLHMHHLNFLLNSELVDAF